jgi:hypothetical protein
LISDGSQYLTRDAGLTGISDGTQMTLNLWLYLETSAEGTIFSGVTTLGGTTTRVLVDITSAGICQITARNSAGTVILDIETSALIQESWNNILLSVDLSDFADRHLYVNDTSDLTVTTYTNASIDLTLADWSVFALPDGSDGVEGGIAELWFDDSYIDLSVESNRRLFIDEYGRPVNLSLLSSLIYLREGANIGTGGDFTENGTFLQERRKISGVQPILESNAFFSSERSLTDVLRVIAATGNASKRISDKVGVVIDNDRASESPIESFTQRNSSGLTIRRAFPRIPDGLRIAFNDENNDYLPNEIFIFRKFPASIIEAIDYTGITDEASARDRAAKDLRQLLLRNALYQVGTDIQHLYCTKGSLVTLAHDTLRRHTDSARILKADTSGGDITDIHVDAALRLDLVGDAIGAAFLQDLDTKLLLHFDGSDASTTFTDSSIFAKTFTASGNAQLDTAEFRFGTASGLFDGTGDWIDASDSADFTLDDQDFAIEGWFFVDAALGTNRHMAGQGDAAGDSNGRAWLLQRNTDGTIRATVWQGTTEYTISSQDIYDNDEEEPNNPGWHHVAFTRESDILRLFLDGVQQGSLAFTGSVNDSADELGIGVFGGDSVVAPWAGWIDEFRLTIGEARYVNDFDVPGNAFSNPEAVYLTRGAGLTGAADSGTVAFSFWINPEEYPIADQHIVSLEQSGNVRFAIILKTTGQLQLFARNAAGTTILDIDTDTLLLPNQWFHVCGSVDLSDVADRYIFIDDVSSDLTVTTYTDDDIDFTTNNASVGGRVDGSQLFNGSLAEVWLEDGLFIDFSVEVNRRDFISTNGRPVSLGSDGSGPGVSPLVYLSGQDGDFPTNKGTGGGFTENGSLGSESIFYSDAGFPAGVVVQLQDGTTLTAQVDEEDETSVLTFSTPQTLPSYMSYEGSWAGSTSYAQEDVVINGGESYTCIVDHTSGSTSEPGVGADWIDFWEPLLRDCLVASGPFSSVNKRMLVLGVKINPDLSASLTLVDEGPKPYVTGQLGVDDIYAPDGSRIRAPY